MSRQYIRNRENLEKAMNLEKQGELENALKLFQKVAAADPLNELAWHRAMVVLRKLRKGTEEVKLIKLAISSFEKAKEISQKQWIKDNGEKALKTKELARALGLLGANGLPKISSEVVTKWQARLDLLGHRLATAKNKATKKSKTKK
jgi:tetratricopeptide (TPR) repeat protein